MNWMSESLPFLIMVTITCISLRWRISYPCRVGRMQPRDFRSLFFVQHIASGSSSSSTKNLPCQSEEETSRHDECCPICLETYHNDINRNDKHQQILRTKNCGHVFHEECIRQWCQHQTISSINNKAQNVLFLSCPCCRSNLNISEGDTMDETLPNGGTVGAFIRSMTMPQWWNDDDDHDDLQWQPSSITRRRYYEQMTGAALGMGILAEAMVLVVHLRQGEKMCPI